MATAQNLNQLAATRAVHEHPSVVAAAEHPRAVQLGAARRASVSTHAAKARIRRLLTTAAHSCSTSNHMHARLSCLNLY